MDRRPDCWLVLTYRAKMSAKRKGEFLLPLTRVPNSCGHVLPLSGIRLNRSHTKRHFIKIGNKILLGNVFYVLGVTEVRL